MPYPDALTIIWSRSSLLPSRSPPSTEQDSQKCSPKDKQQWDLRLAHAEIAYNHVILPPMGMSRYYCDIGYHPRVPADFLRPSQMHPDMSCPALDDWVAHMMSIMKTAQEHIAVKPVRDNVLEAVQLWKEVPSPPVQEGSTAVLDPDNRRGSGASDMSNSNASTSHGDIRTPTREVSISGRRRSTGSPLPSPGASPVPKSPRTGSKFGSSSKQPWSSDRKKAPQRQENPDFFKNRRSSEWHVEVAVPTLKRPPPPQGRENTRTEDGGDAVRISNEMFHEKRESGTAWAETSERPKREGRVLEETLQKVGEVRETCKAEVKEAEARGVGSGGRCEGREAEVRVSYEDGRDREPEAEEGEAMRVLGVTRERGRWRLGEQSRGPVEEVERHLSSGRESPTPKDVGIVHNETVSESRMEDLTRRGDTPLSVVREFRTLSLSDLPGPSGQEAQLGETVVGSVPLSMGGGWPPSRSSRRRSLSWGSHLPVPQDVLGGDLEGAMEELRGAELRAIRRQLIRLEDYQQRMMEMLQDFIRNSQDTLNGVEGRMRALERGADGIGRMVSTTPTRLRASNGGGPLGMMGYGDEVVRRSSGGQYWAGSDGSASESIEGAKWRSAVMGDAAPAHLREEASPGRGSRDAGVELDDRQPPRDHPSLVNGHMSASLSGTSSLLPTRDRNMVGSAASNGGLVGGTGGGPAYLDIGNYENGHSHRQRAWGSVNRAGSLGANAVGNADGISSSGIGRLRSSQVDVLDAEKVDELYACSVRLSDEMELVRLMERTGPVLTKLMPDTAEEVVRQLVKLLPNNTCLDTVVLWLGQLLELNPDVLPKRVQIEVLSVLRELASDPSVVVGGDMIARLVAQLSIHWAPNML
ncbi:hypothetical protein CBR_g12728 [Chara braunii]|uniref:TORTIFOLIA1/TORL1-2 C-terminal domain-containing protein n=1 Tax=Chara braunii TaxID=69332 RepID=A0A388KSI9_CHABU|nr:hypothetical protein CBR_g12728 [Chara braunii]|eukprot:GBG73009.1 hypothetical protein CBR_g12728 [Chara braunii]